MNSDAGNSAEKKVVNKAVAMPALLLQVALLALSVIYARQRMLFSDASHVLFRIVNSGMLHIEEQRYGSFITQMFPLAGAKLHIPFHILIILYSASFTLFSLFASWLAWRTRKYELVILLALYNTLIVSDTWFWTNNEVHQGIGWLIIAFTAWLSCGKNIPALVFAAAGFVLAIWTHPLVMFPALFLWFFLVIDRRIKMSPAAIALSLLLPPVSFLKFYHGLHHGYDSGKIEIVTQLKPASLLHLTTSAQVRFFAKSCIDNYWLMVLLSIAGFLSLWRAKRYVLLVYSLLGMHFYLLLVFITYRDVADTRFYMESEYMPLTLLACAPFVYYTLPYLKNRTATMLVAVTLFIRVAYILYSSGTFAGRVQLLSHIDSVMQQRHITKLILVSPTDDVNKKLLMTWGSPVESMILSRLNNEYPQRTFIIEDSAQLRSFYTGSKDTMLGCFEKVPARNINIRYFHFDTTAVYTIADMRDFLR